MRIIFFFSDCGILVPSLASEYKIPLDLCHQRVRVLLEREAQRVGVPAAPMRALDHFFCLMV